MNIKLRIAWSEGSDQILMKMAAWSAAAHVIALIVISLIPRFSGPPPASHPTIAEIVPASVLFPPAPSGGGSPPAKSEPTPSQRAEAAKEASRIKTPPVPKIAEPKPSPKKPVAHVTPHEREPEREPEHEPERQTSQASPEGGAADSPASQAADAGISFSGGAGPGGIPSIGSSAFPYDYYRSSLVAILQSNWRRPVAPEGLKETATCRIQFSILKSGIIQDPRIARPSGNEALDQSALRAVYNSNPLPPLPFQYAQTSVSAEVVFELTPD